MDIDNYSCYHNYYTYIRPKEEAERYMHDMAKSQDKKLRGNGKRHIRVALSYLVEKCLAEYGALDLLNEVYGEELASKIIELAALSTVRGMSPIDYRELKWDYHGRVHHWCLTAELVVEIFGDINKAGIHEFMRKFYQRNRTDHLTAMEIICRVQFERVTNEIPWFDSYCRYDGESTAGRYMLYFDLIGWTFSASIFNTAYNTRRFFPSISFPCFTWQVNSDRLFGPPKKSPFFRAVGAESISEK